MKGYLKIVVLVTYIVANFLNWFYSVGQFDELVGADKEIIKVMTLSSIFGIIIVVVIMYLKLLLLKAIANEFGVIYTKWWLFAVVTIQVSISSLVLNFGGDSFINILSIMLIPVGGILTYYFHRSVNENTKKLLYVTFAITVIAMIITYGFAMLGNVIASAMAY